MSTPTTFTNCKQCQAEFDTDSEGQFSSVLDACVCDSCYQNDLEAPSTVFYVKAGEVTKNYIGDIVHINEYGDDIDLEVTRQYVSTDAWRGYYTTTITGWSTVSEGWTTGEWDDVQSQRKEYFNDWCSSVVECPPELEYPFAIIFDATSNVFSTAVTVQVPTEHLTAFTNWLGDELKSIAESLS
jgi:hypothetical protein